MKEAIQKVVDGKDLTEEEAKKVSGVMYLSVIRFVKAVFIRLSEFFGVNVFVV